MDDSIPLKHCSLCNRDFPATTDYFHRRLDGLHSRCKTCRTQQTKEEHTRPETRARDNARSRAWQETHKDDERERNKAYRESHKEQLKAYRQANREYISERRKRYYQAHAVEFREYSKTYSKAHPLKNRLATHKRRIWRKTAPGILTTQQIQEKLKAQRYRCYYAACGHAKFQRVNGQYVYHLEHTIPLSRTEAAPRHDINYVVLACPFCNMSKKDKLPSEWPQGGRLF